MRIFIVPIIKTQRKPPAAVFIERFLSDAPTLIGGGRRSCFEGVSVEWGIKFKIISREKNGDNG